MLSLQFVSVLFNAKLLLGVLHSADEILKTPKCSLRDQFVIKTGISTISSMRK